MKKNDPPWAEFAWLPSQQEEDRLCQHWPTGENRKEARRPLVQTHLETRGIRKTARIWGTSRQVVRKWVRRDRQAGNAGLEEAHPMSLCGRWM